MSYLLFLDESGHDHRNMPYEVHGGIALHAAQVWPFVQGIRSLEQEAFGVFLHRYNTEIKGHKLLDKDRFKWDQQEPRMPDAVRRAHATRFLQRKLSHSVPTREEFTAYGQASLLLASGILGLLGQHDGKIFASAVPKGSAKAPPTHNPDDLRKDLVFLLERYYYCLEEHGEVGLIVMDETDRSEDRRLVGRIERYFTLTETGRNRAGRIVPSPLFVASDMSYPIQAADVCIYCVNCGFRIPARGMDAAPRQEVADMFAGELGRLQWRGKVSRGDDEYQSFGIVYVSDLFTSRMSGQKERR